MSVGRLNYSGGTLKNFSKKSFTEAKSLLAGKLLKTFRVGLSPIFVSTLGFLGTAMTGPASIQRAAPVLLKSFRQPDRHRQRPVATIRLRSVNYSGTEYNPQGQPAGNMLSGLGVAVTQWHCNLVRITTNQDYWFGAQGANMTNYRNLIASAVSLCSANNCYVDLDLHWSGTTPATASNSPQRGRGWGTATGPAVVARRELGDFWQSVARGSLRKQPRRPL